MKKVEHILTKLPVRFMKDTYKIIWSDEALNNLRDIIDYLEIRWSKKELKKFSKLLDKKLESIKIRPQLYPQSNKSKGLRRCVLSKQTTIYYRLNEFEIRIISLFDNRQHPNKIKDN